MPGGVRGNGGNPVTYSIPSLKSYDDTPDGFLFFLRKLPQQIETRKPFLNCQDVRQVLVLWVDSHVSNGSRHIITILRSVFNENV